jgi:hypothetical protein
MDQHKEDKAMFWVGLILGLFIGANLGVLVMALCYSAQERDLMMDEAIRKIKDHDL